MSKPYRGLPRPCIRCGNRFQRQGRYQMMCSNCSFESKSKVPEKLRLIRKQWKKVI